MANGKFVDKLKRILITKCGGLDWVTVTVQKWRVK